MTARVLSGVRAFLIVAARDECDVTENPHSHGSQRHGFHMSFARDDRRQSLRPIFVAPGVLSAPIRRKNSAQRGPIFVNECRRPVTLNLLQYHIVTLLRRLMSLT